MIKSMTAFSSSEIKMDNLTIQCELRSVNHRYCDISFKLPEKFRYLEIDIRSIINSRLKRGKIECLLNYKRQAGYKNSITINEEAVKALLYATSQIEEHMHTQQSFTAFDILNYPGIQQEPEINKESLSEGISTLVKETLALLISFREREGSQLAILIEDRCKQALQLVAEANKIMPAVLDRIRTKIKTRLAELAIEPDFDRLDQEMVFLTQKLDVAEELDRLNTHINEVLNILNKQEPIGRRLDFLMQEMNREANTLGSKSADKEMTRISVGLKVLIEQMREQIQNIE